MLRVTHPLWLPFSLLKKMFKMAAFKILFSFYCFTAFIAGFKAELWHSGARQLRQLMVKETAVTEAGLLTVLCSSPHLGRRECVTSTQ
jgi:hypothetical protein